MTKKTLLTLIEEAESALDMFTRPDVSEVQERLHEIMVAAGLGGIADDDLKGLSVHGDMLRVSTSWSVRSCEQTGTYRIPMSIINSKNPLADAKGFKLGARLAKARLELAEAEDAVKTCKVEFSDAFEALEQYRAFGACNK